MKSRYKLSFTTGGLFVHESIALASLYLDLDDWNAVREQVIKDNVLQTRTLSTLHRTTREIIARLECLTHDELAFLVLTSVQDQGYLLWIAICRYYRLIGDFTIEILQERYRSLKGELNQLDVDAFFNRKSEWHPELEGIKPATRNKLKQVLFRILRDAGLLGSGNSILVAMPSPQLLNILVKNNDTDYLPLP
jgi:hypothetical protein